MNKIIRGGVFLAVALAIAGCEQEGWLGEPISIQNNSDQTIILRRTTGSPPTAYPMITAAPHQLSTKEQFVPRNSCYGDFDIVDTSGKVLRKVDKICADGTVVYP